jgi:hypothetical protein
MRIGECSRVTSPKEILDRKSPKELDVLVPSEKFFKALEDAATAESSGLLCLTARLESHSSDKGVAFALREEVGAKLGVRARSRRWISLTRPRK